MHLQSLSRLRDFALCLLLLTPLVAACTDDGGSPTPGGVMPGTTPNNTTNKAPEGAVTYHRDVRPVFDRHCMSCHGEQARGGFSMAYDASDWRFTSPQWIPKAIEEIQTNGSHWQRYDATCDTSPEHTREPSEDEILTLAKWISDGKWEGELSDYEPESVLFDRPVEDPFITFTTPEYLPGKDVRDVDYRCFVSGDALAANTFIKAVELIPGNAELVDHITLVSINLTGESDNLFTVDQDNQEPGFECFGQFDRAQQTKIIHSWSPGSPQGLALPDAHAFVLPERTRLGMQVHYNMARVDARERDALQKDATVAKLWKGSQPNMEVRVLPFANIRLEIPPNAQDHEDVFEFKLPYDATLLGVTPHMLNFATDYRLEAITMDEGTSPDAQCLLALPEWSVSTKQSYTFEQAAKLKQGDLLRQTCRFTNTPERQPMVSGVPKAPEIIFWGTTPEDEMCMGHVLVSVPYQGDNRNVDCSLVEDCIEECPPNNLTCFGLCAAQSSGDCTECAFTELITCGGGKCGDMGLQLVQCLQVCDLASGYGLFCIERNCAFEWQEFSNCGIAKFKDDTCTMDNCY